MLRPLRSISNDVKDLLMEDDSLVNTKILLSVRLKTVADPSRVSALATGVGSAERLAGSGAGMDLSGGHVNTERSASLAHGALA